MAPWGVKKPHVIVLALLHFAKSALPKAQIFLSMECHSSALQGSSAGFK
eukprot:CCRYP_000350-RB/>CCRYP_000350-RB protein AED:0.32 eAED:0.32 QI:0/-1/0/1/-1/0/1/0/48